ncbi:MAG: PQQ-binding-like beta-propeller repeat protein, partial [Limisphaerales bacterium]
NPNRHAPVRGHTLTTTISLAQCAFTLPVLSAEADPALAHWPQWRGPLANGVAPQANPPTRWSETENVKWKVRIPGKGSGTPIVWGNQIFIQTAIATGNKVPPAAEAKPQASIGSPLVFGQAQPPPQGQGPGQDGQRRRGPGGRGGGFGGRGENPTEIQQFALLSLDRATGKTQWQKTIREEVPHEGHHQDHGFASHSPVTNGRHVYGWFGSRGLHCYDLEGQLKWQKDFGKLQTANRFGEGNSPALHGNTLVINWDHEGDDFIAALDASTGKELWRNPRDERTTWTTPFIVEHRGQAQVIVAASQRVRSYDLATGKQLWECGGLTSNVIPTPVAGFGNVYATSGHRGTSLLAIRLGRNGDLTDSDAIAWSHGKSTPYVPSPLLSGDRLYFSSHNNAILSCFDARTGQVHYTEQRLEGPSGFYASPIAAQGRVYLAGRNGTSLVLKDAATFEVLATNTLEDKFDASPAAVGNELYLRGHEHLYCLASQ